MRTSFAADSTDFFFGLSLQPTKKNIGIIVKRVILLIDMEYDNFSQQLAKIKNLPLPGVTSHYKMAPEIRIKELRAGFVHKKEPKKAGVMALFYPDYLGLTHLLLILRKTYKGVHSDQIGFPGGKAETADNTILDTALRETHEEVGVHPSQVEVVRSLTKIFIPPSNFVVQPYMGLYDGSMPFEPQKSEVEALVEVSLNEFMDERNITTQILSTSYADNIEVPAFKLNGYTVWGATAMMLNEIKEIFNEVL